MPKKVSCFSCILIYLLCACVPVLAGTGVRQDVERVFREAVQDLKIPGAVMLIRSPEGEEWTVSAGVRMIGSERPVSARHRFRIGSITKTFVASVVLMLVDEGKMDLDTRVHEILPDIVGRNDPVTVRHLLQMRSNVGNFSENKLFLDEFRSKPWKLWSPVKLLEYRNTGGGESGKFFEYSNTNYIILGMIIEKLTRDTFENQVHRRILKPLNLKSTYFPTSDVELKPPFVRGYDYNPDSREIADLSFRINPSWAWCSGNGVSNANDLMVWIVAYLNGYGISPELHAEQMDFRPALHYGVSYGLGIMNKYYAIGHNGNFAGIYTSLAFRYRGHYFVLLTNGQAYGGGQNSTAEAVFWRIINRSRLFKDSGGTVARIKN
ncbi:serine hydrolase domain-containing protein [Maridesulfovibrio sp. FT414]|uniref:serine hydrolase domain-containing protein n=1 Tax=Maridesulfovibrio sp. FT414 TaxID=2979469 RepID=UPI003D8077A8